MARETILGGSAAPGDDHRVAGSAAVLVRDLHKAYGSTLALDGVSLTVAATTSYAKGFSAETAAG